MNEYRCTYAHLGGHPSGRNGHYITAESSEEAARKFWRGDGARGELKVDVQLWKIDVWQPGAMPRGPQVDVSDPTYRRFLVTAHDVHELVVAQEPAPQYP